MPNRYERDELIRIALNMAQVPNLQQHDIPDGVVQPDAYSIQWLQDILDFWYHMVPFSSTVVKVSITIPANTTEILLPTDFILDVRNGLITQTHDNVNSKKRLIRVPLQKWINRDLYYTNLTDFSQVSNRHPLFYMIQGLYAKVTPQAAISRASELWYYALPAALASNEKPIFPNDYVITEYIRIRALEWCHAFEPGTAQKFCDKIVAGMRAGGLLNEPEDDEIPFDTLVYSHPGNQQGYAWMGSR